MINQRSYLLLFFLIGWLSLVAQSFPVEVIYNDEFTIKEKFLNLEASNRLEAINKLKPLIDYLITQEYLESSFDSIHFDTLNQIYNAYLHIGPQYSFDSLEFDSLGQALIRELNIRKPNSATEYIAFRDDLLSRYGNNGFPFAKIGLKNLKLDNGKMTAFLSISEGPQIIFDSIRIYGNVELKNSYLKNYLGIIKSEPYNHKLVAESGDKLRKLTFVELEKDPELGLFYNFASLDVYLKPKNSSRFDLLFGVIPTNEIEGKQLFISLDFTVEMLNMLGYGEYIFVDFERLRPEQQKFEVAFNYPYLFDLPFALDLDFSIFRNSRDYQTLHADLGVQYLLNNTDNVKVSWDLESSRLIDIDTNQILLTKKLPEQLDVSLNGLAIEAFVTRLDYKFNPRRGFQWTFRAVGGQKTIKTNPAIFTLKNESVDFSNSYDTLDLRVPRFELSTKFSYYHPIAQRSTIGFHLNGGWRYSSSGLLFNEKYQIGGNNLLRGFDEASLFTSYYGITTIEYRLLLSNNSYFSLPFLDIGFIEDNDGNNMMVAGIGASLGIETSVGLFNFSIAAGRTEVQGFDFSKPKTHFGFISLF